MNEELEILRELNFFLEKFRVEFGEGLTRRSALGLHDGLLEDLLQELSLLNEEMANDWLEYDDTDLTGEYVFESEDPNILGINDIGKTSHHNRGDGEVY